MQNFYSISVYTNLLAEMLNKLSQTYGEKFKIVNIVYETQQTILLVYMIESPVVKEVINVSKDGREEAGIIGTEVIRGGGVNDTNSSTQSKLLPNPCSGTTRSKKNTPSTVVGKTQAPSNK